MSRDTDTPRSNAALDWQESNPDADAVVNYGFAQQLERELVIRTNERDRAEAAMESVLQTNNELHREIARLREIEADAKIRLDDRAQRIEELQARVRGFSENRGELIAMSIGNDIFFGLIGGAVILGTFVMFAAREIAEAIKERK